MAARRASSRACRRTWRPSSACRATSPARCCSPPGGRSPAATRSAASRSSVASPRRSVAPPACGSGAERTADREGFQTDLPEENPLSFSRSKELAARLKRVVPGGCHTYAKGDDQYPEQAPALIARGEGCHVWDVDGNELIEYGMGLRAVVLGHAYPPVVEAVRASLALGTNFTRPAPIELECAERFLEMIDGADMVKFTKDGSTATTAALKLARAHTRRDCVAICAEHPFFSY